MKKKKKKQRYVNFGEVLAEGFRKEGWPVKFTKNKKKREQERKKFEKDSERWEKLKEPNKFEKIIVYLLAAFFYICIAGIIFQIIRMIFIY